MVQLAPVGRLEPGFGVFFFCFLPHYFLRDLISPFLFGLVVVRLKFGLRDETVSG